MNTISKIHKRFSEYLNNPRVLTNPEEFLGPNYEEVLNFWIILEELSEDQLRVVEECYSAFHKKNYSKWDTATDLAIKASEEVVGWKYASNAGSAALDVTNYNWAAYCATRELIAMHLILDQQLLTFFEMFLDLFI